MRQPKPFFRKFTKTWYVQIGKRQINLGKNKDEAFQKYFELMANRGQAEVQFKTVAELFDSFLTWVQKHRAEGTYKNSKHYLNLFARYLGPAFTIANLQGIHVTQWIESRDNWTSSTGNDAVSIVQRAFNWGVKRGDYCAGFCVSNKSTNAGTWTYLSSIEVQPPRLVEAIPGRWNYRPN